ncbi:MAG: TonB-dependent receptor [Candidatus Eisenbacteria bacterium]|nr:TonB-dependent receptor [Candidatus Eisenbacteria bacterium]
MPIARFIPIAQGRHRCWAQYEMRHKTETARVRAEDIRPRSRARTERGASPCGPHSAGARNPLLEAGADGPRPCRVVVPILGWLLCLALAGPIAAQSSTPAPSIDAGETATVTGLVRDASNADLLPFANILVTGTRRGTISQDDGRFRLAGLPPGEAQIVVTYIGYEDAEVDVQLEPRRTIHLTIDLQPTIATQLDAIQIRAERPLIDVSRTSTEHTLSARDLESLVTQAPTLDNVVAQQPGVVRDRGKLHFRGGRSDENLFVVDGVKVKDLLSGESMGSEVAARAAQEVSVITGGFGARYSQAMSGVVETRLKEGTGRWHGSLSYETDALFGDNNLHHFYAEASGPNLAAIPLLRLAGVDRPDITFFGSLSCDLADGYLPNIRDLPGSPRLNPAIRDRFLGSQFSYGDFFVPRAANEWRAIFKSAWKATPQDKFSISWTKTLSFNQDWGSPDIGDIDRNVDNFPWSWAKSMDRHYTVSGDVNILSLIWNRTLGLNSRTTLRLWRHYSGQHRDVDGQLWDAYDTTPDWEHAADPTPYFVDSTDASGWRDRHVIVWGAASEWAYEWRSHRLQWGVTAEYHDVQYMSLNAATVCPNCSPPLPLGDEFDLFHVTPNAGNLYLQDEFEHEGMVVSAGFAYDYWFPGAQVERALAEQKLPHMTPILQQKFRDETYELFGHRFKGHLSPRLAVSFPTSERAHLFFNYGHYSQRPPYYYVYAKSGSQSGEEYPRIGNPTLNPEISVQYELGTEYQFSDILASRVTMFWKDMYDYPTSLRIQLRERTTTRSNFFIYWNEDYARSRGIEISLLRRRHDFWRGTLSYTYSVAKGKSSDPNKTKLIQELGGDSRETDLAEEFLWWNRPHKFTAHLNLRVKPHEQPPHWLGLRWPADFSINLYYKLRSGRAYTPLDRGGLEVGERYSRSGPYDSTFDLTITKGFHLAGRRFTAALKIYNLFDYRTPLVFDYVTGEPYAFGKGSLTGFYENPDNLSLTDEELYFRYIEEQDTYPPGIDADDPPEHPSDAPEFDLGAFAQDVRRTIVGNYYRYSNPSYYGQPRTIRLGISYAW